MSRVLPNELELTPEEKRALLADLLRKKSAQPRTAPLSFAQQRLWLLAQLEPNTSAYNIPRALRLKGTLDVQALAETLNAIVARHEALRANFDLLDGQPVQLIANSQEIVLPLMDLQELSEPGREAVVKKLVAEEALRPFNLAQDKLLRAALLRLSSYEHILLLTMHHIVSDGWSMGILVRELTSIYGAVVEQRAIDLPRLPIQYADFARWQREWLRGDVLEKQVSYWREQLAGTPAGLDLPIARPRSTLQTVRGAYFSRRLAKSLSEKLNELSRREGATLFMTLLAAFQTLLMRYSGREDIIVGSPIAGRNRAETEDLIGFFVNSLALRTDLSGNPSFRELLQRVKEVALSAYANQDLPFEKLVEELHPERSLSYSPIFQVMCALQNQPKSVLSLSKLEITPLRRETETAKFDLTLYLNEDEDGLSAYFEYNADLFDAASIERMADHFAVLLEGIIADPKCRVAQLPLLTASERQQVIVEWNVTDRTYPQEQCIQELFEAQVEKTPTATAVVCQDEQLTYRELNERANQVANYLQKREVGPETVVGISVERSIEMIVGLVGILKAGGAYLPLDPSYPDERLSLMLEDGRASVLLTDEPLMERLPDFAGQRISLNSEREAIRNERNRNPQIISQAENLAYVIYTSGSTGRPKGVGVAHRSIVRLVKETNYARLGADEVFLQFAPLSFDASTFEIWGSLLNGARLVVMPPGLPSLTELGEALKNHGVTTLWLTAGLFHQMVETQFESLRGLRQLLAGGDALQVPHVEKVASELSGCQLINGYGPTENTTFACCYRVAPEERFESSVPIGFPISNTRVYILDSAMEPIPVGIEGELYLGGDGLARGYLNDASLTAEKFVPGPFGGEGARLYRTGDRARYLADGRIEFLGRMDQQVKIRGYRIEPAEIESVLSQHPTVKNCVVVAHAGTSGKRLVAYAVLARPGESGMEELRIFLKEKLPDFMVPTSFVELNELPLTPNGKLDRKALPHPDQARTDLKQSFVAPRNDTEQRLAAIWTKVLGRNEIGVQDNFFELGGHSLLAVRLMAEIEKEWGQKMPLVSLFQTATIEGQFGILQSNAASISWPTVVEIQAGNSRPPLFCVSTPNVNALGYRSLARYLGPDQPVYGLQAQYPEDLEGEHSRAAVEELANSYLSAMRAVRASGPYQLIGLCRGAHIAYEMARRLEDQGQQVALLGILDTWVLENTYSYYWYVEHYGRQLSSFLHMGLRNQLAFIRRKAQDRLGNSREAVGQAQTSRPRKINPLHETYFPGAEFVPPTYRGPIAVFRVRRQPLNRIRDVQLGWGGRTSGVVDVHIVPGKHGNVLKEPNVGGLAEELKKWLLKEW